MGAALNHEVSGVRLSPTILFLHGFMGSSADWRGAIAALGYRYFCIAVDLPGMRSTPGSHRAWRESTRE
jgi:2-succinyl-6-hydroxy-2,4-cyclohexadiene-1-carboxylate synthase